jgi:hypothetical protein
MTDPVPPDRPEPAAVPDPLRPGEGPRRLRFNDVAVGFAVALVVGFLGGIAGGLAGTVLGEFSGHDLDGLLGGLVGVALGVVASLTIFLFVSRRRRAAPGFVAGVALVLGLVGLLASACFLGA